MKRRKKNENKNTLQVEYSGRVTVSVVKNDKVIRKTTGHNSGTYRLFEYISKCLASTYEGGTAPKYLQVFHTDSADDEDLTNKTSLVGIVGLASSSYKSDKTNNSSTASLTFTIPGELFDTSASAPTPNLFALYSTTERLTKTNQMATYYLATPLTDISSDTNVIVVWELTVGNKQ